MLWLTAVMSIVSACADAPYERISAWDGRFSTPGRIVGLPDTLTAVGDSVQLSVEANEQYRNVQRRWFVRRIDLEGCPLGCGLVRVGEFTGMLVAEPTSYPRRWEIEVLMGVQRYYDTVVTRQIPTTFRMPCRGDSVCGNSDYDAPIDYPLGFVELRDANGVALLYQTDTARVNGARFISGSPELVDFVDGVLRSRFKDGSAWIIREQFGKRDSLRWVVQQQLGSIQMPCPAPVSVGDTVRLRAAAVDARGAPMNTPVTFRWSLFYGFVWDTFLRPIAQDGSFVPMERGDYYALVFGTHPTFEKAAECWVRVQ